MEREVRYEMATEIKAIPTLKGREARAFLRHAEEIVQ